MSRYLVKCPLSLERLEILDVERVRYSAKDSREGELKKVYEIDPLQCHLGLSSGRRKWGRIGSFKYRI